MALGIVSLETGGKGQNLRVTVPGESAELANLRWSQVGSAPTATGGTILPVPRAQLWQGEVPLGAGREGRRIPRVPTERRLRGSKGGRRGPTSTNEVTVTEWPFPNCFICSHVLPWALMFSNLDQRDLKCCHKG